MVIQRPACPSCGSSLTHVERSLQSLSRVVAGACVAFFSADVTPLNWKCRNSGFEFRAIGAKSIDPPRPGFPLDQK